MFFYISDTPLCQYSYNIATSSSEYLCEILDREIAKNHDSEDHILPKIIQIITESRAYSKMHANYMAHFAEDCISLGLPKSIVEVYVDA